MLQNPGAIIIPNNYSHLMIARNLWVMSAIEKISRNNQLATNNLKPKTQALPLPYQNHPTKSMKLTKMKTLGLSLAAAASLLGTVSSQAQTFLTDSYTNKFDLGTNTADFTGGSAASWIYWYNVPGGNTPITVKYGIDANNQTNTSGCLEIDSPFGASGTQNIFFGTFANHSGYDFGTRVNMTLYTNVTFDVKMAPGIQPRTNSSGTALDFGTINVGFITSGYGYNEFAGGVTIPLAASNSWVHLSKDVDITLANEANVPGLAFKIASYGGYPRFPFTNYLDNIVLKLSPVQTPPPTLSGNLEKPVVGFNAIDVSASAQYDRDQIVTVADSSPSYSFVGAAGDVTYSWNIASFPSGTGGNFQQHFFIVNGAPGPYDQAADYNLADCIFVTVQQSDAGLATMNFRYKTNQPAGNGMLFNGTNPTNTVANPNGWPVMPVGRVTSATGAKGTWSVTFKSSGTVALTSSDGSVSNFVFDAASAAIFANPVSLILGGQANNVNGAGQAVVYNSFSATGVATPISENFATETAFSGVWKDLSSDPNNATRLVPAGSAYWLRWSIPDAGFSLQTAATVNAANWTDLTPVTIQNAGKRQALIPASTLPSLGAGYYRLIKRTFTKLQVLLPGETNAPGTVSGKTGTPIAVSSAAFVTVTINSVDATWHIVSNSTDLIKLTSTDGAAVLPNDAALSNGTLQQTVQLNTAGSQTITATDASDNTKTANTSAAITVQ